MGILGKKNQTCGDTRGNAVNHFGFLYTVHDIMPLPLMIQ